MMEHGPVKTRGLRAPRRAPREAIGSRRTATPLAGPRRPAGRTRDAIPERGRPRSPWRPLWSPLLLAHARRRSRHPYSQDFESLVQTDPPPWPTTAGWSSATSSPDGTSSTATAPSPRPTTALPSARSPSSEGGDGAGRPAARGLQRLREPGPRQRQTSSSPTSTRSRRSTAGERGRDLALRLPGQAAATSRAPTAAAFIKTLDPGQQLRPDQPGHLDMTTIPADLGWLPGHPVDHRRGAGGPAHPVRLRLHGHRLRGSAVFYDNLLFEAAGNVDVPDAGLAGAELGQNFPNPFNPSTRIEFSLEQGRPGEPARARPRRPPRGHPRVGRARRRPARRGLERPHGRWSSPWPAACIATRCGPPRGRPPQHAADQVTPSRFRRREWDAPASRRPAFPGW